MEEEFKINTPENGGTIVLLLDGDIHNLITVKSPNNPKGELIYLFPVDELREWTKGYNNRIDQLEEQLKMKKDATNCLLDILEEKIISQEEEITMLSDMITNDWR